MDMSRHCQWETHVRTAGGGQSHARRHADPTVPSVTNACKSSAQPRFHIALRVDNSPSTTLLPPAALIVLLWPTVINGGRVFGRAFAEAYKQAQASSQFARAAAKNDPGAVNTAAASGMTLDEACKILNVKPPQGGITNMESVMERFKKLYDLNEPKKGGGGSFYLQSKILRARERIEMEVRNAERKAQMEKEIKEGWRPKLYKN
ncbi:Mitochondrial import inner membrane translocase subunit tim16 [Cladophialophora carrionii]|uniref:Mitochondrial import inner membrane translocase subunit TIM16 n=1 Tax=Cladophialophora carrionii TaxID=86049 RepID=A0A1C1CRL8_9EURO|nr:Mitochondrial import inner membrane translocase subunit tim16 [Cladophialophora carrionii]